jgi:hypothetical protein
MLRAQKVSVFLIIAALAVAGCGGGGWSAGPSPGSNGLPAPAGPAAPAASASPGASASSSARALDIAFTGTNTLSHARHTLAVGGTPVTVTFNGATVATGTLDANGHATLTFTSTLPRGATVTITAGSITVTLVLMLGDDTTAAQVQVNSDGTITVSGNDEHAGGSEQETMDEDGHGHVTVINTTFGSLPSNLPIQISSTCTSVAIAPNAGTTPKVLILMKSRDSDDDSKATFQFSGTLTGPLTFPILGGSLRLKITVFDPSGATILKIQGPIVATTDAKGSTPCPTPTESPEQSPSPRPTEPPEGSPEPTNSPEHSPRPTTSPTALPSTSPSPNPTATPTVSPTPSATP